MFGLLTLQESSSPSPQRPGGTSSFAYEGGGSTELAEVLSDVARCLSAPGVSLLDEVGSTI